MDLHDFAVSKSIDQKGSEFKFPKMLEDWEELVLEWKKEWEAEKSANASA